MKLGSLRLDPAPASAVDRTVAVAQGTAGHRDGRLVVIRRDLSTYVDASPIAATLQGALDDWERSEPLLRALSARLEAGQVAGTPLSLRALGNPLPRAYEWIDGSAYLSHVERVRAARGAEMPDRLRTDPLVYQGGSGSLLGPFDNLTLSGPGMGLDFEGEICVILGDTPMGTQVTEAHRHVRLLCLANDITLRELVPGELEKGFGFFLSKPATAFSPVAVTPDELGSAWRDGRVHLPLETRLNGKIFGRMDAGAGMNFSFFDLIAHITKTRSYVAGTILGSGTVSSADASQGFSCLVERRAVEKITDGKAVTAWMKVGDRVEIEMLHPDGTSLFGAIDQQVKS